MGAQLHLPAATVEFYKRQTEAHRGLAHPGVALQQVGSPFKRRMGQESPRPAPSDVGAL